MYQAGDEHQSLMATVSENEDKFNEYYASHVQQRRLFSKAKTTTLTAAANFSILLNIILLPSMYMIAASRTCKEISSEGPILSEYAHLSWNTSRQWLPHTEFYDRRHKTQSWRNWEAMEWEQGVVALTDGEVREMNLPWSPWLPWDESKGVYVINAYHNLHCLAWLRRSLSKFQEGGTFGEIDWHGFHCLDHLRQDTICYADDTPIHSHLGDIDHSGSKRNPQTRQCRDFGVLDNWVRERTACYRFLSSEVQDPLDRHKFCPEDSPYNSKIEAYYGPDERQRLTDLYGDVAV